MPSLFFSGAVQFSATGPAKAIAEVEKGIKEKQAGIALHYDQKDMPAEFEIWPWHIQNGKMAFAKDKKSIVCTFDGVAKVPVAPSAFEWIIKKKAPLYIAGVKCNGWILKPLSAPLQCPLTVGAKAPKASQ